jgi:gliding motility-associated-like protein
VTFVIDSVVGLSWTDRSSNETGFRVERSTDSLTFSELKSLDVNTVMMNDSTVWPAFRYFYRVVAFNAQGVSGYSNIVSVTTTGYNHAPAVAVPLIDRNICSSSAEYTFTITGLTPGASDEATQSITVTGVTTDKPQLFSAVTFVPQVVDGVATFTVHGNGTAVPGDTVTVFMKVKDNGGIVDVGTDTAQLSFRLIFVPLSANITADRDTSDIPRYVTVHLTAATNYPSSTPEYLWDEAEGIDGERGGIVLDVRPVTQTTYTVHATSTYGCTASAQITLIPDAHPMISNVITPNGDGVNDKWIVWNIDKHANNSVKVFDRAGRLVYTRNNYANDWDGTYKGRVLDEGMYYYIVDYGDGSKPVTGTLNILKEHK